MTHYGEGFQIGDDRLLEDRSLPVTNYRSSRAWGWLIGSLFTGYAVVGALLLAARIVEYRLVSRAITDPSTVSIGQILSNDDRLGALLTIANVAYFVIAAALIAFTYRVYANARALGAQNLPYSPGWAIGAWFVPIVNLYRPIRVLQAVWRSSDPALPPGAGNQWQSRTRSVLLAMWWAAFLVGVCLRVILNAAVENASDEGTLAAARPASAWGIANDSVWVVAAVLGLAAINGVWHRQEARAAALQRGTPAPVLDPFHATKDPVDEPHTVRLLASAAMLAAATAAVGFALFDPAPLDADAPEPPPQDDTAVATSEASTTQAPAADADTVESPGWRVGACYRAERVAGAEAEWELGDVAPIPCAAPHSDEVFAIVAHPALPGSEYPGPAELEQFGVARCEQRFESYVAAPPHRSTIWIGASWPSEDEWERGGRDIACLAGDPLGDDLVGSVRGSGGVHRDDLGTTSTLPAGTCFNDPAGLGFEYLSSARIVFLTDCEAPHGFEVFAVFEHRAGPAVPYPADEKLIVYSVAACAPHFERYVGAPVLGSGLGLRTIFPSEDQWALGEREMRCVVRSATQSELSTSMRNTGGLIHEGLRDSNTFAVGDCFDEPTPESGFLVPARACDEPHDFEVLAIIEHENGPEADYPGEEALWEAAETPCIAAFEDYVGIPFWVSDLVLFPMAPTLDEWTLGSRSSACVLAHQDLAKLETSLRGAER